MKRGSLENWEQPWWSPWKAAAMVFCPQVVLRIRPLSDTELEEGATIIAHKAGDQVRPWGHRACVHRVVIPSERSYRGLTVAGRRCSHWVEL